MERAGIEGEIAPGMNKVDKTRAWLKVANDKCADPLAALGTVLAELMEVDTAGYGVQTDLSEDRQKIHNALGAHGLSYFRGGLITALGATAVSRTIEEIIRERDLAGLQTEFDRIFRNVESDPATTVTASCALLESLFKTYIEDENLQMPADQSIRPLWKIIRADLNFDPGTTHDPDLKTVLSGLIGIVEGIGALRTHKGSAHGQAKATYKLKPRHARLAAHASFTIANFVLETWGERP